MKYPLLAVVTILTVLSLIPSSFAGDCTKRDKVDWQGTITTAVNVRDNCPTGDVVGVAGAGEVVRILEVDKHGDFYLIESKAGTGFIYNSFLKDINKNPAQTEVKAEASLFVDLNTDHQYYEAIAEVKAKGIVSGTPEGKIHADNPINRVELAKILVEATTDDSTISKAQLDTELYSDIEKGAWYLPYLEVARAKGIMTGDANASRFATVRPGDNANGAEVAKMIAKAFDLKVESSSGAWYQGYLDALKAKGALPYDSPSHIVTRGEMMFMISVLVD